MSRQASVAGRQSVSLWDIYKRLDAEYQHEHWHWMPEHASPIEIVAGAILVQHTTWQGAERALDALRKAGLLDAEAILAAADDTLLTTIRVSGTPGVKARRLRAIARTIVDAGGLDALFALPLDGLRATLLATHGIGPETADAIALYAGSKRTFVIDAYTRRVFRRIGVGPERDGYEDWRGFCESALPDADVRTYQRFHAWIVLHAKAVCRPTPLCDTCPLSDVCEVGRDEIRPRSDGQRPIAAPAARNAR